MHDESVVDGEARSRSSAPRRSIRLRRARRRTPAVIAHPAIALSANAAIPVAQAAQSRRLKCTPTTAPPSAGAT